MKLTITGRHVPVTPALREYVTKRLQKADQFQTKLEEARVIFSVERNQQVCEVVLHGKHQRLVAKESSGDLYSSIDLAVDKLIRQLRRVKERTHEGRHKHVGRHGGDFVTKGVFETAPVEAETNGSTPRIEPSDRYAAKPMTPEEAALQLSSSKDEFLVFQDAGAGRVSVIYRRGEDRFGLIAPDFDARPRARGGSARS